MAGYKPVAIQTYPILGEKITQDTLYWNNYKVSVDKIVGGGGGCFALNANFSSICYTLDMLVKN